MTRRGILDAIPLFIPAIPFAFVLGLAILDAGVSPALGWSSSSIIYAGAAQLTLITLLGGGAVWIAAVTAALVINARHALYSVALAPAFQQQPRWFRWVGSFLLIDQLFVLADARKHEPAADFRRYYLSVGLFFFVLWNVFVAIGLVVGPTVSASWGLAFAIPVMFVGMLVGGIDRPPKLVAAVVGGAVTALAAGFPNHSGLLVGAAAGIAAGFIIDRAPR